jgi:DtxR family transcriptional regulator, Mn-dependent transcriptional regulator
MLNPADDALSHSVQDYLKMIYVQTRGGQPTRTGALAEALDIRPASVTNMLQKLAETQPNLVSYRKHHGVSLTPEGEKAALQIIRRHRLLEQFLYQTLEYPLEKIHAEAEELEHAISPFFAERIAQLLHDPAFDPHGDPIPDRDLNLIDSRTLAQLSDLRPGESGVVRLITNQNPELLVYLQTIGVCPGTALKIIQLNPIDGTQQIEILENGQTQVLGKIIGESIQVEVGRA